MKRGTIYLIPTPLAPEGTKSTAAIAAPVIANIRHFIVEEIRTARRFLRAVDPQFPIDDCTFTEMSKHNNYDFNLQAIAPAESGQDIGVMSEAGCPAIADPGHQVAAVAQSKGITIKPLPGPNSMLMALMASGFSGQQFTFHGYLPMDVHQRKALLQNMERQAALGQTHIFMETPFRNQKLFEDLCLWLQPETMLCIASNITASNEIIRTRPIKEWRKTKPDLKKIPAVFVLGKG